MADLATVEDETMEESLLAGSGEGSRECTGEESREPERPVDDLEGTTGRMELTRDFTAARFGEVPIRLRPGGAGGGFVGDAAKRLAVD